MRTQAATEQDSEQETPAISFKSNERAALGYVESDSAGQTNIFAVQPPQYVEGSVRDVNTDSSANTTIAAGVALLGFIAVALGVTGLLGQGDGAVSVPDSSETLSLSQYSAKFTADIGAPDL